MSHCLKCGLAFLLLCLAGSGCDPRPETSLDEQKNPHFQAGKERLSALDYKGAVVSFERALEDNPRSALAHYELGVLFDQHESDYAAALYHYNKALKLKPSGYPSENIRQRVLACRQELIKEDSLAVINPSVLRETERLREENQALRKQIEQLQAHVATRPPAGVMWANSSGPAAGPGGLTPGATNAMASRAWPGIGVGARPNANGTSPTGRPRTHAVKQGETAAAIARLHQIKLPVLLAANPGVEPRRLRVGQVLNVPAP
jgi:tetratricopeptide (TPR) repeat protein